MLKKIIYFYKKVFWSPIRYARNMGVKVGNNCSIQTRSFGSEPYLIEIGDHVQITNDVKFFTHGAAWCNRLQDPTFDFFGKIKIGDNVYIGNNALIMPGVTIGNNVIIGAGAIVTKSIKDNLVVVGNPAKEVGKVDNFIQRIGKYNLGTKGLSFKKKKIYLQSLDDDKFIKK